MLGLFDSCLNIVSNVADIATAPVRIAVDVTAKVTKPVVDIANEIVDEIKDEIDSL